MGSNPVSATSNERLLKHSSVRPLLEGECPTKPATDAALPQRFQALAQKAQVSTRKGFLGPAAALDFAEKPAPVEANTGAGLGPCTAGTGEAMPSLEYRIGSIRRAHAILTRRRRRPLGL